MRTKTVIFRSVSDMLDFVKKVENYPLKVSQFVGL